MSNNLLVINVEHGETRIALIENGIIAEFRTERTRGKTLVGNVYLGKVIRVLSGMQAAFVDIGQDKAAFLHVGDLIRPDDFERYISGDNPCEHDDEAEACTSEQDDDDPEPDGACTERSPTPDPDASGAPVRERRSSRSKGARSGRPARVSRETPIREVVREGQEIIV